MKRLNNIVVFVLGGPGSGKGTQGQLITRKFRFNHISAGELLRFEQQTKGSEYGKIIQQHIMSAVIVPSYITVKLLKKNMEMSQINQFLIDGFPRNIENLQSWRVELGDTVEHPFLLHLACTEQEMMNRLKKRAKLSGRQDDIEEVILKRFVTYQRQTMKVVQEFERIGKVVNINADREPQAIFKDVQAAFRSHRLV